MGLDPNAVLAVAHMEGLGGGVGDNGTSFGPFQLHLGGAMPRGVGNPQQWANSPAGIDYALQRIASVARGQKDAQAISSIVSRFERPANPAGEIAGAERAYGGSFSSGQLGGKMAALQQLVGGQQAGANPMAQMLLQEGMQAIGQSNSPEQQGQTLLQMALARKMLQTQAGGDPATPLNIGGFKFHGVQGGSKYDQAAIKLASHFIGTPYEWGGASPGGFDCSGLLQYTWGKLGVNIPRTTYDQWKVGQEVAPNALRPGDAVFFKGSDSKGGLPGHVGMYIGGGRFIEAPHSGSTVHISNLRGYPGYMGARRYA
jgi:cell wall-associated NlpC family hydrolase